YFPRPWIVTEMLLAPCTTWLLVRTSPEGVRIIPVPAAWAVGWPLPPSREVSCDVVMSTTPGSTRFAIACVSRFAEDDPVCCGTGFNEVPMLWGEVEPVRFVSVQPMPMPALSST